MRLEVAFYLRNIPAYAGKTTAADIDAPPTPEHPRVCGENTVWHMIEDVEQGTSPRMRGKPQLNTG